MMHLVPYFKSVLPGFTLARATFHGYVQAKPEAEGGMSFCNLPRKKLGYAQKQQAYKLKRK